jgi:hypothetical protein
VAVLLEVVALLAGALFGREQGLVGGEQDRLADLIFERVVEVRLAAREIERLHGISPPARKAARSPS